MNIKERTWTTTAPTEPGEYLFRCDETGDDVSQLHVYMNGKMLMVDDPMVGTIELNAFHDGLTEPEWSLA